MARSTRPPGRGRPMTMSSTSRSVRSLATASSSGTRPFIGTSLDEVTISRPGRGSTSGRGRNTVWSTPTGTTVMRSGRTPIWAEMSVREDSETVTIAGRRRATRSCIRRKPNHRWVVAHCQGLVTWASASWRSTVIGWCRVVSRGHPSSSIPSMPGAQALVVVDQVEVVAPGGQQPAHPQREGEGLAETCRCTSPRTQWRRCGPGTPWGGAPGRGRARGRGRGPGTGVKPTPSSRSGHGLAGEDLDRVAEGHAARGSGGGCRRPGRHSAGCPGRPGRRSADHRARAGPPGPAAGMVIALVRSQEPRDIVPVLAGRLLGTQHDEPGRS